MVSNQNSDKNALEKQLENLRADKQRFQDFRERCIKLYEEYDNYAISLNNLNTDYIATCKKLEELEKEKLDIQKRLKELQYKNIETGKSVEENVKSLSCLLGFTITDYSTSKQCVTYKLHFNELCFVHLQKDKIYDVLEIQPTPKNFVAIKKYLQKTQDIQGFLITLRKFFKYATTKLYPQTVQDEAK